MEHLNLVVKVSRESDPVRWSGGFLPDTNQVMIKRRSRKRLKNIIFFVKNFLRNGLLIWWLVRHGSARISLFKHCFNHR